MYSGHKNPSPNSHAPYTRGYIMKGLSYFYMRPQDPKLFPCSNLFPKLFLSNISLSFFFFEGHTCGIWKLLGRERIWVTAVTYDTATATSDWILNPLAWVRDWRNWSRCRDHAWSLTYCTTSDNLGVSISFGNSKSTLQWKSPEL